MSGVTVGKYYQQPIVVRAKSEWTHAISVWHGEILIINPHLARATRLQVFTIEGFAHKHGENLAESLMRATKNGLPHVWVEPLDEAREDYKPDLPCIQVEPLDLLAIDRKVYRLVRRNTGRISAAAFCLQPIREE